MRDIKVSYYENAYDATTTRNVSLFEFLTSEYYKDTVLKHRRFLAEGGDKKESPYKKQLGAITVSGTFTKRNIESLENYNQLIAIDIDGIDDPEAVKEMLKCYSNIMFIGLSVSGDGLVVIVNLDCDVERHKNAFFKLERFFKENHDLEIDAACKDVSRLRFATYDPNPYINENATKMSVPDMEMIKPETRTVTPKREFTYSSPDQALQSWAKFVDKYAHEFVQGNGFNWLTPKVFDAKKKGLPQHEVENILLQYSDGPKSDTWIKYQVNAIYKKP